MLHTCILSKVPDSTWLQDEGELPLLSAQAEASPTDCVLFLDLCSHLCKHCSMLHRAEFAGFDQKNSPRLFVEEKTFIKANKTHGDCNILTKLLT